MFFDYFPKSWVRILPPEKKPPKIPTTVLQTRSKNVSANAILVRRVTALRPSRYSRHVTADKVKYYYHCRGCHIKGADLIQTYVTRTHSYNDRFQLLKTMICDNARDTNVHTTHRRDMYEYRVSVRKKTSNGKNI